MDRAIRRNGFTLVELLVVLGIIGLLLGLLLPAIQRTRESANRIKCTNNIKQLVLGCHDYESAYSRLPNGGWCGQTYPPQECSGWAYLIDGFIEKNSRLYICPSKPGSPKYTKQYGYNRDELMSDYAGCNYNGQGVLIQARLGIRLENINNGCSNTIIISESYVDLAAQVNCNRDFGRMCGWDWDAMRTTSYPPIKDSLEPTNWSYPSGCQSGIKAESFGTSHDIINVGYCDGSVIGVSLTIDRKIWELSGRR